MLCGLELSPGLQGKSASICLSIDGRVKKWIVYPHPYLQVQGELIPTLTISQVYKYLGVNISPQSTKATVADTLKQGLSNISKAPLKPQQRLYTANCHLVPKLLHQLTLTPSSAKYLKWLDLTMQSAVRSWLTLPKDTSTTFFHAKAVDGGLNLPLLEHEIPLLNQARAARMADSNGSTLSPQGKADYPKWLCCGNTAGSEGCVSTTTESLVQWTRTGDSPTCTRTTSVGNFGGYDT